MAEGTKEKLSAGIIAVVVFAVLVLVQHAWADDSSRRSVDRRFAPVSLAPTPAHSAVVYAPFDSVLDLVKLEKLGPVWFRRSATSYDSFNAIRYECYLDDTPWERLGTVGRSFVGIGSIGERPRDLAGCPSVEIDYKADYSDGRSGILPPPSGSYAGYEYTRFDESLSLRPRFGEIPLVKWPCVKAVAGQSTLRVMPKLPTRIPALKAVP